ncbi:MAG TPA: tripartite tricarboxylate transporter substrate binding protein [Ramlibacter sp.]|nr:tripartite tricarboxylate transporter substrate binding protein [Ramlibacter sp.]
MMNTRDFLRLVGAGGVTLAAGGLARAQQWPEKPIRLVHPYAGGGTGDQLTRELAAGLQQELGVAAITDNRPGGGTVIGSELVAKSPPDGYNILMVGPATHVIMPAIHPKLPYHPEKDFELIGMWAVVGNMISVHPSVPVNNLRELVEYSRKNPGKLNYSTAGVGTGPHLGGETFKHMTGANITHVPYKGAAPAVLGLLSGEVQVTTVNIPPQVPHIKAGKIKPIAVFTSTRSSQLPDVPTAAEAGVPGLISESWYGLGVPAGTPAAVRTRLQQAMFKVGNDPERKARMAAGGVEVKLLTPQQLAEYIKAEDTRLRPVIKALDLKVE